MVTLQSYYKTTDLVTARQTAYPLCLSFLGHLLNETKSVLTPHTEAFLSLVTLHF